MATRIKKITIGTPLTTPVATFLAFDSGDVLGMIDSAYVQARQITYTIDSNYVQARQDFSYSSLTGVPNVLDSINVQSIVTSYNYVTTADIDSAYIQNKQLTYNMIQGVGETTIASNFIPSEDSTYSLGSPTKKFKDIYLSGNTINLGSLLLKANGNTLSVETSGGQPANLNAVNYTDSDVLQLVDSAFIQARQAGLDSLGTTISFRTINIDGTALVADVVGDEFTITASGNIQLTPDDINMNINIGTTALDQNEVIQLVDSDYVQARQNLSTYGDSNVQVLVDSAYVQARQADIFRDSAFITEIVDSAYITSRQNLNTFDSAAAISALNGANLSTFTNDVGYTIYDSAATIAIVDSAYVQARQNLSSYSDSNVQLLVDSAYVQARQVNLQRDSGFVTDIVDSAYINTRVIIPVAYGDSDVQLLVDSAYVQARQVDLQRDSGFVTDIVDSAYVQARQAVSTFDSSDAISALNGANLSIFTNDVGYTVYDSTNTLGLIDSAYVLSKITSDEIRDIAAITSFANVDFGGAGGFNTVNFITDNENILAPAGMSTLINGNLLPFTLLGATPDLGTNTYKWDRAYIQTLHVGNIIPHLDETYDIGTATNKFKTGYFAAETLSLGGLLLSAIEDSSGNVGLGVTADSATPPAPIPTQEQVEQTTANVIATSSRLQDISNVNDSPGAGQTIIYDGGTFQWTSYYTPSDIKAFITGGTGVTVNNGQVSIGQSVGTTDNVVFNNVTVAGNLQVDGTQTIINTQSLSVVDNMIYLNSGESAGSPTQSIDIGFAGNYNEGGTYAHAGLFRDASDQAWKFYDGYLPEPDAASQINTGHASFTLASVEAKDFTGKYLGFDSDLAAATTDDLAEGANQYYTDARSRAAVSADGDLSYDSATGVFSYTQPTTVSTFTNDAGYTTYDSANTIGLVDSAYVQARVNIPEAGVDSSVVQSIVTDTVDSAYVNARVVIPEAGVDSSVVNEIITTTVDSAYVNARVVIPEAGIDSAAVVGIIDSAYILGKVTIPDDPAITTNGSTPSLADGIGADEIRSLIGVDEAGVDNSTDVTLAGSYDYLTLSGQEITLGQIDAATDITGLANVATSGSYNDLSNTPTLATVATSGSYNDLSNTPTLATVATSGSYTDLTNKPNILDSANVLALTGGAPAIEIDGLTPRLADVISAAEIRSLINLDSASVKAIADDIVAIQVDGLSPVLHPFISPLEVRTLIGAVDSAFVIDNSGVDSAEIISIINDEADSAYVRVRQDYSYASITGAPDNLNQFANGPGYLAADDLNPIEITSFKVFTSAGVTIISGIDANGNTISYTPGTIHVFMNGVKLIEDEDFTATNGNSITLAEATASGDVVEIVGYTGQVLLDSAYISISSLKSIVASSATFADFKTAVAGL